jgi:2-octaprenyl-3-methyl-6-methoxy-1,4-benzoquinol hydroxylase
MLLPVETGTTSASNFDFIIIGAGITGCTLALGLHRQKYRVLLVEKETVVQDRFKGEFLQPYALDILRKNGFSKFLDENGGRKITELRFRDLRKNSPEGISSQVVIPYPSPHHALAIPHKELLTRLRGEVAEILQENYLDGCSWTPVVKDGHAFEESPCLQLQRGDRTWVVEARVLVGADGRNSRVRAALGAPSAPNSAPSVLGAPAEMIVGCEAENLGLPSFRYEVLRTSQGGTISLFPISENRARIYWHTSETTPPTGSNLREYWINSLEKVFCEIAETTGIKLDRPQKVAGASAMTCFLGHSSTQRVFLVGDAVAVTTPLGGQGMTCGLYQVDRILTVTSQLGPAALESSDGIAVMAKAHAESSHYIFSHFTVLNTGLYYLFFSKLPFSKRLTRHVLRNWQGTHQHVERLAALFGGLELDTPNLVEVMKLWGVPVLGAKRVQDSPVARIANINPAPIVSWMMNQ